MRPKPICAARDRWKELARELLSTSDTVIGIHATAKSIQSLVGSIQAKMGALSQTGASEEGEGQGGHDGANAVYELGVRIKFLLDTPETVWSCLDGRDFAAGARRYLAAAEVHRVLTSRHSRHSGAAHLPLLQHQWPLIRKFRGEIQSRTQAWLRSEEGLLAGPGAVTGALCALALLKPLDGEELLKALLSARQAAIEARLKALGGAGELVPEQALGDLAACVAGTIATAAQLFCRLPGVTAAPRLQEALRAERESEQFPPGVGAGPRPEQQAWQGHADATLARLATLGASGVALELGAWLDGLTAVWAANARVGEARDAAELKRLETGVRARLAAWRSRSTAPAARRASRGASLGWEDVSLWALGAPRPLWALLLEPLFLQGIKALVQRDLRRGVAAVGETLELAMARAPLVQEAAPGASAHALEDAAAVLAPSPDATGWARPIDLRPQSGGRRRRVRRGARGACAGEARGREAVLEPHARLRVGEAAREVAALVRDASERWASAADPGAQPVLVVGHVAAALASRSRAFATGAADFVGECAALRAARAPLLEAADRAFGAWSALAAREIAARFAEALAADAALCAAEPVRAWRDVSVDQGSSFALPFAPSPAALAALVAAAREADDAALAAAGPEASRAFETALAERLAAALTRRVAQGDGDMGPVSEPGALQLAFDAQTLACALGAAAPGTRRRGGPSGVWAAVEAALAARLDPIDWATAAPRLETLVPASLARSKLLLGSLSGASKLPAPAPAAVGSGAEASAAPSAQSLLAELERDGGRGARYSFAALSERARDRAKALAASSEGRALDDVASGAGASGAGQASAAREMGAAAIEALRGSKLGTLLGDRAAEMMGDMSFGSSLFSSFTSGLRR
ncbi:hypothetical protein QBZ16_004194 [Prototheca wickerhamii]|uniref:Conserved oligomeric Golgi complex subunit 1 n=1 Tax=Prototheca wickerhamii TaxID=3111 RepID=A0AAD9IJG0_PROWI|nr:hypothetical protein QBZ16_004194 [Prototheca wickerhamii]